jgi:hypothetical protein
VGAAEAAAAAAATTTTCKSDNDTTKQVSFLRKILEALYPPAAKGETKKIYRVWGRGYSMWGWGCRWGIGGDDESARSCTGDIPWKDESFPEAPVPWVRART